MADNRKSSHDIMNERMALNTSKKKQIKVVCKECGKDAPVDFEKSNKNWTVYATTCDKCGGQTGFSY